MQQKTTKYSLENNHTMSVHCYKTSAYRIRRTHCSKYASASYSEVRALDPLKPTWRGWPGRAARHWGWHPDRQLGSCRRGAAVRSHAVAGKPWQPAHTADHHRAHQRGCCCARNRQKATAPDWHKPCVHVPALDRTRRVARPELPSGGSSKKYLTVHALYNIKFQ